ncbi:MAG: methylated-DNA--[protein]-cysteine S-methyltransferase [Cryobacterium sp.]|nr:methylated-DNA--[protein]-cysteine S-methyltransferase [Cryobacterium sp.]
MALPPAPSPFLIRFPSPLGRLEVLSDGEAVTGLAIEAAGRLPHDAREESPNRVLERARAQLEKYFAGSSATLSVPLALRGTPFQLAIWNRLRELRHGETLSYGTLGAAAGVPGAGRAVAAAIRSNPIPLLVPCHRVLTSEGTVTGWSHGPGIEAKLWLLKHEAVVLAA